MTLFPPQEQIINSGLLEKNEHLFINMATGSGKTFLAELAIESVLKSGYKTLYITPLRALASQQSEKWKDRFSNYNIGVFTGDTIQKSNTKSSYSKSQILIMTPERLDSCMRNWRSHWSWIPDISLAVIDEFHIMGQAGRGPRLEGTITRLIRLNPFLRIIGLSATIPNDDQLSAWLHGTSFRSNWRQIPLEKQVYRFKSAKDKPELLLNVVNKCIESGGQSLVFCNSRSRVQSLALYLRENKIAAECHHAGLLQEKRQKIESEYKDRKISVLVATSTLEMGLNLPARQVVIYDSYSFSEGGFIPLPVWSFMQRAGRAGRPGLDSKGEVVLFLSRWGGRADKYIYEQCEPVYSQLTDSKAMQEQILIDVYSGFSRTREELIHGFLPLTFYKKQHEEANINGIINKLILADLLIENPKNDSNDNLVLKVGLLGRLAVRLMFAPSTIKLISDCYATFNNLYLYDLLLIAALSEDCSPILQANYEEMDSLCEIVQRQPSSLLDLTIEKIKKRLPVSLSTTRILAGIKMSAICLRLINDEKLDVIAEKFDVFESDILLLKENVVRLLTGISAVIAAIDKNKLGEELADKQKKNIESVYYKSSLLTNMLQYQISSEYATLTKLDGVGGKTARLLVSHGFTTLKSIANADFLQLSSIKSIGKKRTPKIMSQAADLLVNGEDITYSEDLMTDVKQRKTIKTTVDPYRLRRSMELSIRGSENGKYLITGGREDHIVIRNQNIFSCDCLDYEKCRQDCKHILCVKRSIGDSKINKMAKRIKESKSYSIRESLPSLWFSVTSKEII